MDTLRLGTRRSALAQAQAHWVAGRLSANFPDLRLELVLITTSGDQQFDHPHPPASAKATGEGGGLKAMFTKEIEEALLDHRIDLAVHSLKDMPAVLPAGLTIGAVPPREDARDVWISKINIPFDQIPPNAKIGTGAIRRQAQIRRRWPGVEFVPIRGNVDTRIRKLAEGNLDGLILALAGLKRLHRQDAVTDILPSDVLVPAIGQGCLAIEVRKGDRDLIPILASIDHPVSHFCAQAERALLRGLGGTCQTPIAGHAEISGDEIRVVGLVITPNGEREVRDLVKGPVSKAEKLGKELARRLLALGADQILSAT
jgi:hydroxymethylbilane synthase